MKRIVFLDYVRGLYFLGGICGGLLYMLAYNVFPYFQDIVYSSYLLGACCKAFCFVCKYYISSKGFFG